MAEQVRLFDWSSTPLGPPSAWPPALHTTLGLVLNSPYPMWFVWGDELTFFYNDAFRPLVGGKPEVLGKPFAETSVEAMPTLGPIMQRALGGESTYFEDLPLTLERYGLAEMTTWTFAYSPILGDTGEVAGVLCVCHETTGEVKARAALSAERERLLQLFEEAPSFIAFLSGPDHVYELTNAAHQRLTSGRVVLGMTVREALPELEGQGIFELFDDVFKTGRARVETGFRMKLADASGNVRERFFDSVCQPVAGEDGSVTGIFVEGHDVTERVAAEAIVRNREERLRLAIDAGRMATWDLDVADGAVTLSAGAQAMLGLPLGAPLSIAELEASSLPSEFDRMKAALTEAQQRKDPFFEAEFRHPRADDGQVRWFLVRGRAEYVAASGSLHCFGVLMDITERKEAEDRLHLLTREVDHRANNLLAAVQSVVNLTRAEDVPGFRARIRGRIRALANAHRLLAESRWTGAGLARVVAEELEPYSEGEVHIAGPDARLAPPVAQALAIALHELATNAAKHGSLSTPEGRTRVTWSSPDEQRLIHMTWQELGGPPTGAPTHAGFGTTLLARAFAGQRGGAVELDWRPEGLRCRLTFPAL